MTSQKISYRPVTRKYTIICNAYSIIIYPDLNRYQCPVILVGQSIKYSFPNSFLRKRIGLNTGYSLTLYIRPQIFRINQINDPVRLGKQRSMNFILIPQIRIIGEISNLHIGTGYPFLDVFDEAVIIP